MIILVYLFQAIISAEGSAAVFLNSMLSRDNMNCAKSSGSRKLQQDFIIVRLLINLKHTTRPSTLLKMFRTALLRSARSATSQAVRSSGAIARPSLSNSVVTKSRFAPAAFQAARCYSASAGLSKTEVEGRIVDLLKNFDKVSDVDHEGSSY